jgi:hypothetical protein
MQIILLDEAIEEITEVTAGYERLRPGLGNAILDEVESKLRYVAEHPLGYESLGSGIRRVPLRAVPFQLFYAVDNDSIIVLGLADGRMEPSRKLRSIIDRFPRN